MENKEISDDCEIINDEISSNEISTSAFDITIGHATYLNIPNQKSFAENLYEEYHGSSPRFPGGNCVFASILTFMSYEKINNMINYVLTKQKELNNEQLNDIIVQIFKNTPKTKNRDIISYMRAYVYIYLVENLNEYFEIGDTNSQLTNLVNGGYTFINQYTMQALCEMTGTNILVFKNPDKCDPILCSVENGKYSDERIYIHNSEYHLIKNYAAHLRISLNETNPTVVPSEFNDKDTISIFCFKRHCTPFVPKESSIFVLIFKFFGTTILVNLFSFCYFFKPRLGVKEINTQKLNNFISRDLFLKQLGAKNSNWKTITAATLGIIFALGVATVSALTFGFALIPALLITKIAIGLSIALSLASFVYSIRTAIQSKKNEKQNFEHLNSNLNIQSEKTPPPQSKISDIPPLEQLLKSNKII